MDQLAPPVVAVVVTCNPGPWFEETLTALAAQDYPNYSILVLDAASAEDPTGRVASVSPSAYVRRLEKNKGFGASANDVLEVVEGAQYLLICHDDVAPDPDCLHQMVEEAFRSNAGIVAPKLVDWDDPNLLLQVGMGADKFGAPTPRVGDRELDQEQHDSVRDVFVAPGGATMVRADLFSTLGGFDESIFMLGEDLDLSWRAQLAGARVVVAPAARVRHRQATSSGEREIHLNGKDASGPTEAQAAGSADGEDESERPPASWDDVPKVGEDEDEDPFAPFSKPRKTRKRAPRKKRQKRSASERAQSRMRSQATLTFFAHRRHELRAVLKNYSTIHLARVVPQLVLLTLGELSYDLVRGRTRRAQAIVASWRWNLEDLKELRRARKEVREVRLLSDSQVRRLQVGGSARVFALLRRQVAPGGIIEVRRDTEPQAKATAPGVKPGLAFWGAVALVILYGSRHLLGGPLPLVGQLAPLPGVGTLFHQFGEGWRTSGVGSEAPAPLAFGLLGTAGTALFGATGVLHKVLFLGALPVGALGVYRLCRPMTARCRCAATLVYLALPLAYNALASGRLETLLLFGAFPWILSRLFLAMGQEPFAPPSTQRPTWRVVGRQALSLGIIVTLLWAFAPPALLIVALSAVALALGSLVAGRRDGLMTLVAVAAGSIVVALVLAFPWTLDFLHSGSRLASLIGLAPTPARALGFGQLLRFETGPLGAGPLGYVFVAVAALPLVIARRWRFEVAARCWALILVFWVAAWMGGRGWLGQSFPPADLLCVPAAVGVAVCTSLGLAAFETDLPRYRFGWRQGLALALGGLALMASVPVLAFTLPGTWNLPAQGFDGALAWMPAQRAHGSFRVLWLGDPSVLPLTGWRLSTGLAYATSEDGLPSGTDLWPTASPGNATLIAQSVQAARAQRTALLGRMLAPFGVRYVVVPTQLAPSSPQSPNLAYLGPPPDLPGVLNRQIDLRQLDSGTGLLVYENVDWAPVRSQVAPVVAAGAARAEGFAAGLSVPLVGSKPVLTGEPRATSFVGRVSREHLLFAASGSSRWSLTLNGSQIASTPAFGWANQYRIPSGGQATLSYQSSPLHLLAILVEVAVWAAAVAAVVVPRRRARRVRARPEVAREAVLV